MTADHQLSDSQVLTLEALADTVVPGRKRHPDDVAISGVDDSPGAVEAGAVDVLTDPATGIADGVGGMADILNALAEERFGAVNTPDGQPKVPAFVHLDHANRRAMLAHLCSADNLSHELWFLMALFAYMAYDSAPHLDTAAAVRSSHPGLTAMGFRQPDVDGLWRAPEPSYNRVTAHPRPGTDAFGNLP